MLAAVGCQNQSSEEPAPTAVNEALLITSDSPGGEIVAEIEEPVAEHCIQSEMNAIVDRQARALEAFECGDELFEFQYNAIDGVGAKVGDNQRFTRTPRADKKGPDEWYNHFPERKTGPNGDACNSCHAIPATGAGPAAMNVARDPMRSGDVSKFIQRNTPHLMMSGALQLLAEEMSAELKASVAEAQQRACDRGRSQRVSLESKGVDFGRVRVRCDGSFNTRGLEGIDSDLVLRPFQWKGENATLRDFNRGASHNELGMQPVEITGDDVDGDGDGVVNEFGIGDMTAMAVYVAGQARPLTLLELDDLGLMHELDEEAEPLTADERADIMAGEVLFAEIGCADCHRPSMLLDNPVFAEPSRNPDYRDEVFPAGQDPLALGVDPDDPVLFDLTQDQPDNVFEVNGQEMRLGNLEVNDQGQAIVRLYGDLKRHDMGRGLAESVDDIGTGKSVWLTKELWGVGSTAPYMHDGRATTITEAILEHGGAGSDSRRSFRQLDTDDQAKVVAFLNNLVLLKVE